jgi:hypothetical protein
MFNEAVHALVPQAEFHHVSGCVVLRRNSEKSGRGLILVICAGTSHIPVAEEAAVTADLMGNEVEQLCDVGVAGLHRLRAHGDPLMRARVLIVCAGMEGALPSGRWPGCGAGHLRTNLCRLRCLIWRTCRAVGNVELLLAQYGGRQY